METSLPRKNALNWLHYSLCLGFCTFNFSILARPVIAQNTSIPTNIISSSDQENLLDQGRIAYQAGRYAEATEIWTKANQNYQTDSLHPNFDIQIHSQRQPILRHHQYQCRRHYNC